MVNIPEYPLIDKKYKVWLLTITHCLEYSCNLWVGHNLHTLYQIETQHANGLPCGIRLCREIRKQLYNLGDRFFCLEPVYHWSVRLRRFAKHLCCYWEYLALHKPLSKRYVKYIEQKIEEYGINCPV